MNIGKVNMDRLNLVRKNFQNLLKELFSKMLFI